MEGGGEGEGGWEGEWEGGRIIVQLFVCWFGRLLISWSLISWSVLVRSVEGVRSINVSGRSVY